jgi:hypothetical protein
VSKKSVKQFRDEGQYLPDALKDFHDQKDIFKLIHGVVDVEGNEGTKSVSWVTGHCYVIDVFLWAMARYGYTLQKSRANVEFESLTEAVAAANSRRSARFAHIIESAGKGGEQP